MGSWRLSPGVQRWEENDDHEEGRDGDGDGVDLEVVDEHGVRARRPRGELVWCDPRGRVANAPRGNPGWEGDDDDETSWAGPVIDVGDLEGSLLRLLGAASRALSARLSDELQLVGVTGQQWLVLQEVGRARHIEPSEVARNLGMARPTVTEILGRLRRQGLVTSEQASFDGRLRVHQLTNLGWLTVEQGRIHAGRVLRQATARMTSADQARLREMLARVSGNLAASRRPSVE